MTDVAFVAANPAPRTIAVLTSFRAFTASSSRLPPSLIGSTALAVQGPADSSPLTRLHARDAASRPGNPDRERYYAGKRRERAAQHRSRRRGSAGRGSQPAWPAPDRPVSAGPGGNPRQVPLLRPRSPAPAPILLHRFRPLHRAPPGRSAAAQALLVWRDESSPSSPRSPSVRIRAGRSPQSSTARYRRSQPAPIGDAGETSRARARDEKRI